MFFGVADPDSYIARGCNKQLVISNIESTARPSQRTHLGTQCDLRRIRWRIGFHFRALSGSQRSEFIRLQSESKSSFNSIYHYIEILGFVSMNRLKLPCNIHRKALSLEGEILAMRVIIIFGDFTWSLCPGNCCCSVSVK